MNGTGMMMTVKRRARNIRSPVELASIALLRTNAIHVKKAPQPITERRAFRDKRRTMAITPRPNATIPHAKIAINALP